MIKRDAVTFTKIRTGTRINNPHHFIGPQCAIFIEKSIDDRIDRPVPANGHYCIIISPRWAAAAALRIDSYPICIGTFEINAGLPHQLKDRFEFPAGLPAMR